MIFTEDLLSQFFGVLVIQKFADLQYLVMLFWGTVRSAVREYKLRYRQLFVPSSQQPDCPGFAPRSLFDRFPYVAFVGVHFARLGEAEVGAPGVAVVADELDRLPP